MVTGRWATIGTTRTTRGSGVPVPRDNVKGRALLVYWSYQAEPDSAEWHGLADKIGRLAGVAFHFFTRTRWNRTFRLVR